MERNTILAIVLSALVLFGYQAIFVPPKQSEPLKNSQTIAAQSVSATSSAQQAPIVSNTSETTNVINKTEDYEIKNKNAVYSYTNVGGSLHKIDFLKNNPFPVSDMLSIGGLENVQ